MCKELYSKCIKQFKFDLSICKIDKPCIYNPKQLDIGAYENALELKFADVYIDILTKEQLSLNLMQAKAKLKPFGLVLIAIKILAENFTETAETIVNSVYQMGWRDPVFNLIKPNDKNKKYGIMHIHALT